MNQVNIINYEERPLQNIRMRVVLNMHLQGIKDCLIILVIAISCAACVTESNPSTTISDPEDPQANIDSEGPKEKIDPVDPKEDTEMDSELPANMTLSAGGRVLALKFDSQNINDRDGLDDSELKLLSNQVYQSFEDEFDFIFFVSAFTSQAQPSSFNYSGRYSSVSASEKGLGFTPYNYSEAYGSAGRLQGVIHLTKVEAIRQGPSLHELMHRWGNFALPSTYYSHWAFASSGLTQGGQLGGFSLNSLADLGGGEYQADNGRGDNFGVFANGGNGLPYSSYELAQWLDTSLGKFSSLRGPQTLSVNEALRHMGGAREPIYGHSQDTFRILTVLIYEDALDTELMNKLDSELELFARVGSDDSSLYNFYEATRGRASLEVAELENAIK